MRREGTLQRHLSVTRENQLIKSYFIAPFLAISELKIGIATAFEGPIHSNNVVGLKASPDAYSAIVV
jgi:hypothetical protein